MSTSVFLVKKKMSVISNKGLSIIEEKTILENALSIFCLYESQLEENKIELEWLYERNKEKFFRKFKLKFPSAEDDEIENFMRIYLYPKKMTWVNFYFFALKEAKNVKLLKLLLWGII